MNLIQAYFTAGVTIFISMTLLWALSLAMRNSSIVDIFWGLGFVVVVWLIFTLSPQGYLPRRQLVAILVTIWGIRLALYIGLRNLGKPEDFRYAKWREENGRSWWWVSYFKVFLLQGLIMWILSAPLIAAQTSGFPAILTPLDVLGMCVWGAGLLYEVIADAQLSQFKRRPSNRGKILTTGLWKYSRHPNYFGEAMLWWGYYLLALAAGAWWTVFAPILMTYLLIRVSGVVMLEKTMAIKPGYQEYMKATNAFLPWFPKK
jgi:steroid 5-alpha reductase family enzyme